MNHETQHHIPSSHEREFAALSYLWIFSVLIAFSPHGKSSFIKHHAQQGVVLFVLSCVSYFLPGWLYYLELLWIFLMVLGCIEAGMGNYYTLPLIGGLFHGKKHFQPYQELFSFWFQKVRSFFTTSHAQSPTYHTSEVPAFIAKTHTPKGKHASFIEKIEKTPRSLWSPMVEEIEVFTKEIIHPYSIDIRNHRYGFELMVHGMPYFYFGGVDGEHFTIAYHNTIAFLPGSEVHEAWHFKSYFIPTLKKENYKAFIKLLFEEGGLKSLYKSQEKTVV